MIILCLEAACILATASVCILIFVRQRDAHAPLASLVRHSCPTPARCWRLALALTIESVATTPLCNVGVAHLRLLLQAALEQKVGLSISCCQIGTTISPDTVLAVKIVHHSLSLPLDQTHDGENQSTVDVDKVTLVGKRPHLRSLLQGL